MNDVRLSIALVLVLAAGIAGHGVNATTAGNAIPVTTGDVQGIPPELGPWRGADAGPLDDATRQAVGADRILNRTYAAPGLPPVGLYIAAYDRQRPTVSIHSPLHCLPGTGWSVLSDDTRRVPGLDGSTAVLRRLVAVRDRARVVILYAYAIHGRMVASDALSRVYLLADSLRLGRNDAALVRLVIPVSTEADEFTGDEEADRQAETQGLAFLGELMPHLDGAL